MTGAIVRLSIADLTLDFAATPLSFTSRRATDLFARKNNRTLEKTIHHAKYAALAPRILSGYHESLGLKLGEFLAGLKEAGDPLYRQFLNKHGDRAYCEFSLQDEVVKRAKGLYCFTVRGELKYIGKSEDSFGKRISQGYGRIHPKNCYRDGQSTNCHLNALIAAVADKVNLHVHPMVDNGLIRATESALISKYNPEWNVQLSTGRGHQPA